MIHSLVSAGVLTIALIALPGQSRAQCDWVAANGVLPDQMCTPWMLSQSAGAPSPVLGPSELTIATTSTSQNVFYIQQAPQLSLPPNLIIEATVEYVTGFSNHNSRAPGVIAFDVSSGWGNMLFIGDDEIFLNMSDGGSSCSAKGPSASVSTKGGGHTYRIEVDTALGGAITVFHDGVPVLTGATFKADTQCFVGSPRVFWGEGSGSTFGVLKWSKVSHNAIACTGATESVRLGSPPNPNALMPGQTSGPVVGTIWDPVIDHSSFLAGASFDFLALSVSPANIPLPPFGTILCSPAFLVVSGTPGVPFNIALPGDCNLVGASLCAQGASADLLGTVLVTNALDITIGAF